MAVFDQYELNVNGTRKIRGAILCETDQGPFLLKELSFSERRLPDLTRLYEFLIEQGCADVDFIVKNKENCLVSEDAEGEKYLVKRWYYGKECDSKKEVDILDAVRNLACLHHTLENFMLEGSCQKEPLECEYMRHNRELKKVRSFIRKQNAKGEFETHFLQCFEEMYAWAECATKELHLIRQDDLKQQVVHGDYNYHNLLITQGRIATTGFERFSVGSRMDDLYYFLRKIMEKNQWNAQLGYRMLNQYQCVKPMTDAEIEYLAIRIAYPEKYWKLANTYNRSNKAWISAKTEEKLHQAIRQTQIKKQFLERLFSFSL